VAAGQYSKVITLAPIFAAQGTCDRHQRECLPLDRECVEELVAEGNYATTLALANGLFGAAGIARDAAGNPYVSEGGSNRALKLSQW
jgi:hypothetical protein